MGHRHFPCHYRDLLHDDLRDVDVSSTIFDALFRHVTQGVYVDRDAYGSVRSHLYFVVIGTKKEKG